MGRNILFLVKFGLEPISYNAMYATVRHRKRGQHMYMTDEARNYEEALQLALAKYYVEEKNCEFPVLNPGEFLKLTIEYGIELFKDKDRLKPKMRDCTNFTKPVEDAIVKFVGIDDSYNFETVFRKMDYKKIGLVAPFIFMSLEVITEEEVENNSIFVNYLRGK